MKRFEKLQQNSFYRIFVNSFGGVVLVTVFINLINMIGIIVKDLNFPSLSRITSPIGWIVGNFANLLRMRGLSSEVNERYKQIEHISAKEADKLKKAFLPTKRRNIGITLNIISVVFLLAYITLVEVSISEEKITNSTTKIILKRTGEATGIVGLLLFLLTHICFTMPLERRLEEIKDQYEKARRLKDLSQFMARFSLEEEPQPSYGKIEKHLQRIFPPHPEEPISKDQLAVFFQRHLNDLKKGYERENIIGDGDCGFRAFDITREEAADFIIEHLDEVRDLLQPILQEVLRTEDFFECLQQKEMIRPAVTHKDIVEHLEQYASDLNILSVYVDFDIREKQVKEGWTHPAVLQALAYIHKINLRIWELDEDEQLIPHRDPQYAQYNPPGAEKYLDLLFVHHNHFDRLKFFGYGDPAAITPPVYSLNIQQERRAMLAFLMAIDEESFDLIIRRFYLPSDTEENQVSNEEAVEGPSRGNIQQDETTGLLESDVRSSERTSLSTDEGMGVAAPSLDALQVEGVEGIGRATFFQEGKSDGNSDGDSGETPPKKPSPQGGRTRASL